ncbi:MAG: PilT/PilU family type 4a pilus ATPase [Gammaproteobacteria bacterium]|nr:PilT/PilU family type 4a pilus ATPase [Gammaproteobacteria bacterium]
MDRDKAIRYMHELLHKLVQKGGSDLFITVGAPPSMKIDGKMTPLSNQAMSPAHTQVLVRSIMNDRQLSEFDASQEVNFAISLPGISRFRVNAFTQRGSTGLVIRVIQSTIPDFKELLLPDILKDIAMTKRGLVIFVGSTGSGKSTSLASMIGYRNKKSYGHIITIEDPIEFVHQHENCIVTQREVGVDTASYEVALKNTLRQAPDVILIGEIRDRDTMEYAIQFAETGHLCLSTLHSNNTNQAIDRIVNFFPEERRQQLLMDLSLNLRGMVSQRLIARIDGKGRVPAVEVMLNTPLMADLIFKGNIHSMKELISKSNEYGMQTFDQALFKLFEDKLISYEDALRNADSVNDLRLRIKLESAESKKKGMVNDLGGLTMAQDPDDDNNRLI